MKKNKLAMVDLDDTLIFTLIPNHLAYQAALREQGFDLSREEYASFCNGHSYKDFLPRIMGENHPAIETVHDRKTELYAECLKSAEVNQRLVDILRAIKPQYHIALVTTASRTNVERILSHFGLSDIFDALVTREDVVKSKPDPSCYLLAMERFGAEKENCIIFEDSPSGIKAALASGCPTMCIKSGE
ncbi:MAG: HAD family phosphatase [Oscillospiraceae bacterium]|nr:HAD family phosphatase [Oscillospiraceae bacterium]